MALQTYKVVMCAVQNVGLLPAPEWLPGLDIENCDKDQVEGCRDLACHTLADKQSCCKKVRLLRFEW